MMGKMKERRRLLTNMLRKCLSKVIDDPKVRRMLTPKEAENGLETVIERVVNKALKEEARLGRELTFQEFRECMMETLDEIAPKLKYII
jgi:hypothetical protein